MKQFLFVAIAALAFLSSCTKTPSISVSVSIPEGVLSASGGAVTANVASDGEWRASAGESVVVEPSSGSGNQSVIIKVDANTSSEERDLAVTFSCILGASNQDITIHQKSPGVSVSVDEQKIKNVSVSGDTIKVKVVSDGGWKAAAGDGIMVTPSSGSEEEIVAKIIVSANTSKDEKDMEVKFSSALNSAVSRTLTIHQASMSLSVTPKETDVAASGGPVKFAVTTAGEWIAFAENGTEVCPSSGSGSNNQVKVTVPENTTTMGRDIKVSFYSTQDLSLSQTVTIHQKAPGISVIQTVDSVLAKGGDVMVNVTSDGGFTVPVGDCFKVDCSDWKESGTKSVKITVDPNATGQPRDVKVTFRSKLEPSISQTVTIHQKTIGISVIPSADTVSASGGEIEFTVDADGAWKAAADTDGATVDPGTWSDLGEKKVKVSVPANVTGLKRDVTVKFWLTQNPSIYKTVTISQVSITISVTPSDTAVSALGGNFDVSVSSNGKWEAYVGKWKDSDGQQISTSDQIYLSSYSDLGNRTVEVTVPANTTGLERYVEVEFRSTLNSSMSQTVTIHQKTMSISVTEPTDSMPATGGKVGVTVISDGVWTANSLLNGGIPNPSSGSSGESVIIEIPTNNTDSDRDVKVRFYLTNHSIISDTVIIHQKAPSISVTGPTGSVSGEGGDVNVTVTSDGGWGTTLYNGATVSPGLHQGSGNDVPVTITVPMNTGEERDIKVIEFYSLLNTDIKQTVTIHQESLE